MVQNAILEGADGVSNVLHIGGACPAAARTIARPGPLVRLSLPPSLSFSLSLSLLRLFLAVSRSLDMSLSLSQ